jgi:hypothetical protein
MIIQNLIRIVRRKLNTLMNNPSKTVKTKINQYALILASKLGGKIRPWSDATYTWHWNYVSFVSKTVLDLGADYGSTAWLFLQLGAKKVIAVEGDEKCIPKLCKNHGKNPSVVCIHKWINSPIHFNALIQLFEPDIVKVDIEGAEECLLGVSKDLICSVDKWLIETHSKQLYDAIYSLFSSLGYRLETRYQDETSQIAVICARKRS